MTSSSKKRVYSHIDDEEDEEDEEDEDSIIDFLHGHTLFELYSVAIKDIKGDLIQGKIYLEINDVFTPSTFLIFDGNEGKIGEPLSLSGTSEPFWAYDYVAIKFALCTEKLVPWTHVLIPHNHRDKGVQTMEIEKEDWGKVTLTFKMFFFAMDARVNVMFLGIDDDGNKKYPSHVYGEIYAASNGSIDHKVVLFQKSKEEAEPVDNGKPISLSRCLIAAEIGTYLHIDVDLWGFYDSSNAIQASFDGVFKVRSYPCTELVEVESPDCESPVRVQVTWVKRDLP